MERRHAGHDHMSMSMSMSAMSEHMASMSMDMMSMASGTMSMAMASSTDSHMDHDHSSMGDMSDMDGMSGSDSHDMDMPGMNMFFTKSYSGYPVLFESLNATNGGQAFGIFLLIFFVGMFTKFLEFLRNYLEQRVWKPTNEVISNSDSDGEKYENIETTHTKTPTNIPALLIRNGIRLVLIFVPEMLGFSLMLIAMSFSLVYFFAVVAGLSIGKFVFERISDRYQLVSVPTLSHHG